MTFLCGCCVLLVCCVWCGALLVAWLVVCAPLSWRACSMYVTPFSLSCFVLLFELSCLWLEVEFGVGRCLGCCWCGVLCFAGRSQLSGASLQWASHDWPVTAQAAYWQRQDEGMLRSVNGLADHTGKNQGGWLQALWQITPDWTVGARSERVRAQLALTGAGASLLVQEAGLTGSASVRRDTALLSWQVHPLVSLSAETGREQQGGQTIHFSSLRAVFRISAAGPAF